MSRSKCEVRKLSAPFPHQGGEVVVRLFIAPPPPAPSRGFRSANDFRTKKAARREFDTHAQKMGRAFVDITGQRFGRLVAKECVGIRKHRRFYACLCDCGVTKIIDANSLRIGHSKSCGCSRRNKHFRNLTGVRVGRWTVMGYAGVILKGRAKDHPARAWRCRCSCGTERVVLANSLCRGISLSCGCIKGEKASRRFKALHFIERHIGKAITGIEHLAQMEHATTILNNALGSLPAIPPKGRSV